MVDTNLWQIVAFTRRNKGETKLGRLMIRVDDMKKAAKSSGLTLDILQVLSHGLSRQAFLRVMGNASSMPSYMKSSDNPYFVLRANAPSRESL